MPLQLPVISDGKHDEVSHCTDLVCSLVGYRTAERSALRFITDGGYKVRCLEMAKEGLSGLIHSVEVNLVRFGVVKVLGLFVLTLVGLIEIDDNPPVLETQVSLGVTAESERNGV